MHLESPNPVVITDLNIVPPPQKKNARSGNTHIELKFLGFTLSLSPLHYLHLLPVVFKKHDTIKQPNPKEGRIKDSR